MAFIQSIEKSTNGGNNHLDIFMAIIRRVSEIYSSFTVKDVLFNAQIYDEISLFEVQDFFNAWCKTMLHLGRIKKIQGVYEDAIYKLI